MENPIKMDDLGGTIILGNPHMRIEYANANGTFLLPGSITVITRGSDNGRQG